MSSKLREECIKALRKLAVDAGALPSSLNLEEVTLVGPYPVDQGGYSDVFQGKWKDKLVAVKRPRHYGTSGNKLENLKVGITASNLKNQNDIVFFRTYDAR